MHSLAFFSHQCALPRRWCQPPEMFLWIAALSVCSDRILFFLCTILPNIASRLPCYNYKLRGRYRPFSRLEGSRRERHVVPLIYLEKRIRTWCCKDYNELLAVKNGKLSRAPPDYIPSQSAIITYTQQQRATISEEKKENFSEWHSKWWWNCHWQHKWLCCFVPRTYDVFAKTDGGKNATNV